MKKFIPGALLASCAFALATPAVMAQGIGTPIVGSSGAELSPDGFFAAGQDGTGTYLWNPGTGFQYSILSSVFPEDVSALGMRVAGDPFDAIAGGEVPGYWEPAFDTEFGFGPHPGLGGPCSGTSNGSARVISNDGLVAGGLIWDGCDASAYKWDLATGYTFLDEGAGTSSQVTAISGDGMIQGGWAQSGSLSFETCYVWDATGLLSLPLTRPENPGGNGKVNDMDWDGDSYVGRDIATAGTTGFLMYEGTLIPIPTMGEAYSVSGDGRVVGGAGAGGGGPFGPPPAGEIFTTWGGGQTALAFFAQFGVTPPAGATDFGEIVGISDDGNTFLARGTGSFPFFSDATHISLPNNWTDLLGGTLGSNGFPTLDGFGWLNPGLQAGIALENAATSSVALLAYAGSYNPVPLYGGTVGPFPWDGVLLLPTDVNGDAELTFTWPLTMPSGATIYAQAGILDAAGVSGIVLSNNLQITGN